MPVRKRQRRVAILIAGMHRSGTSAVARVASQLGFALPKTLLAPNPGNETGYWESVLINQLNDELLSLAGFDWRAWQPFRKGWSEQAPVVELKGKALSILEGEFGAAQHLVLKDPRLCRLIAFWREVIEAIDAQPLAVCPVRNPLEVAASLEKRNSLVPELSHLIWLRYVLEAEFATRGMRRTFVSYDALLKEWRHATNRMKADLGIAWPRSPGEAANEIDSFLSPTYRHHDLPATAVTENLALPKRLRTTFAILDRWARERESGRDFKTLDRIRRGLDKIPSDLRPIITAGHAQMEKARRLTIRVAREAPEQARLDAKANAKAAQLADVMTRIDETARQLAQRETEARASAAQLTEVNAELDESARQLAERDAEAKASAAELTGVKAQLDETARQLAERETEARASAAELTGVKAKLDETARQLAERETEARASAAQLKSIKAQLIQTTDELIKREAETIATTKQLEEATAANMRLTREVEDARAELGQSHRQREKARLDAVRLGAELHQIRSSPTWKIAQAVNSIARALGRVFQTFGSRREDEAVALVAASNLFDRDWYFAQNPDVATAGIDAALHYVRHGAAEGRDPGPKFSTRWYLDAHKDVAAAGMNPLLHYLLHGMAEGRAVQPSSAAHPVRPAPSTPSMPTEPPDAVAEPLSFAEPQVAGVRWATAMDFVRRRGHASLELCGLILGLAPIDQANADEAWLAIAEPTRALVAFCRLLGIDPREAIRSQIGDLPFNVSARLDTVDPAAHPVITFPSGTNHAVITDIWYVNDRDLRVRFSSAPASGAQPCIARFFQYDLSSGGKLLRVGQSVVHGPVIEFSDLTLTNAFLPLLIAFTTPEGRLLSASLLPFPSLCRGGVHYGELCAVGKDPGYLENLQSASRSLLGRMLAGFGAAPDFSIARIEIDLQGAIGSERIFSTEIREWLACIMRVVVRPANSASKASPKVRAHLEQSLAPNPLEQREDLAEQISARERGGAVVLNLPPDGVPSIHGLASRGFHFPAGKACTLGPFVIADSATLAPQWAVRLPPIGEELLALQPARVGIGFPVLTRPPVKTNGTVVADFNGAPIAVRFCDANNRHPARLIMPIAPDAPGPLLRRVTSNAVGDQATISVILGPSYQGNEAFAALLESLKLQTMGESVEIIAVVDAAQPGAKRAAENALGRFFPDKYRLLSQDSDASLNARLNRAAEDAAGRFLLIAGASIALHDPRTLETLQTMADHDNVASAGCVLLQASVEEKLQTVAFRSGGIFPSTLLRPGMPKTVFFEPDFLDVFRIATYPVLGNSSALFMVRSDIWRTLGGFDATKFPDIYGDIEYGVRAITAGYFHLCTSVVSAELYESAFRASYADEALQSLGPSDTWESITSSASLIEALKA